jgi:hypothetical protein
MKYNKYTPKHGEKKPSHLQAKISVPSQRICVSVEQLEQIISRSVLSFELVIHLTLYMGHNDPSIPLRLYAVSTYESGSLFDSMFDVDLQVVLLH